MSPPLNSLLKIFCHILRILVVIVTFTSRERVNHTNKIKSHETGIPDERRENT